MTAISQWHAMSHFFKTPSRPPCKLVRSFNVRHVVHRRVYLIAATTVVALAAPLGAQQASSIDRAGWLAGCWEARTSNRVVVEMWMPPAGGLMLGASRTTVGGATREYEQLRLHAAGDTLVYTALPSGQSEATFRSTSVSSTTFVVENPAHDFPKKISYRREGADSLIARVEGPGPNNTTRGFDVKMRRASCTP
jgi:hypothetical protein